MTYRFKVEEDLDGVKVGRILGGGFRSEPHQCRDGLYKVIADLLRSSVINLEQARALRDSLRTSDLPETA